MVKHLTRTGNSVALVLDQQLLEAAQLDPKGPVEVSTNGHVIVIAPVRSKRDQAHFRAAERRMHAKYAGAFARLAK